MTLSWFAFCESAELAVELSRAAQSQGLSIEPEVVSAPPAALPGPTLWLTLDAPEAVALARLAMAGRGQSLSIVLCHVAAEPGPTHALASSLGIAALADIDAAVTTAALLTAGGARAPRANMRALTPAARARILPLAVAGPSEPRAGKLELSETGQLRWTARSSKAKDASASASVPLGSMANARLALMALSQIDCISWNPDHSHGASEARDRVSEVLFGPERRLSDPASKAALAPYDIPTPHEELCSSPSRAASEAARMGFPVRITLASPDLRAWDEPDLRVDGVDNAARVRDVYRELTALANERNPAARLLGVTVAQTQLARALLSLRVIPLEEGVTWLRIGFADPHGAAARDETWLAVPCKAKGLEHALGRLSGRALLLPKTAARRAQMCESLARLLNRLHDFATDFPAEVSEVRLHPVALLLSGALEVREAAVSVTDAYERAI